MKLRNLSCEVLGPFLIAKGERCIRFLEIAVELYQEQYCLVPPEMLALAHEVLAVIQIFSPLSPEPQQQSAHHGVSYISSLRSKTNNISHSKHPPE